MGLQFQTLMSGQQEMLALLNDLEPRIQNRIFRRGGKKIGDAIAKRAGDLTPRRQTRMHGPRTNRHLADSYTNKQITYRANATTVNIVGGATGQMGHNRVNHLVEGGTNNRWTGHRPMRKRTAGQLAMKTRKVRTASGGWRTVKERVLRPGVASVGSSRQAYVRQRQAKGLPVGAMLFRGRMPAFHQLQRAIDETPIVSIYEAEVTAGLQRIADRQAAG